MIWGALHSWAADWPEAASSSCGAGEPSAPGCPPTSASASALRRHADQHLRPVKVYTLSKAQQGATSVPGMPSSYSEWLKGTSLLVRVWLNVVHWRRERQPLQYSCLRTLWMVWKGKKIRHERWTPQVGRCPICYWRRARKQLQKQLRAKLMTTPSCGCVWWWK